MDEERMISIRLRCFQQRREIGLAHEQLSWTVRSLPSFLLHSPFPIPLPLSLTLSDSLPRGGEPRKSSIPPHLSITGKYFFT